MLKNYFTIALRQMAKQKMYTAIKVGGFALSIAACILIALFIFDELNYDNTAANAKQVYRVVGVFKDNGTTYKGVQFQPPFAKAVQLDFPEIENSGRLMRNNLFNGAGSNYVRSSDQEQNIYEEGFSYLDQDAFDMFNIPMVYGDRKTALAKPNSLVLTKRKAEKFFPGKNPVGKILYLNDDKTKPFTIGGVMADYPTNTHLQFDYFLTLAGVEFWPGEQGSWESSNYDVYLQIRKGADIARLEKSLTADVINKYMVPTMKSAPKEEIDKLINNAYLKLQPVPDIHLKSYDMQDTMNYGDIRFVWLFGAIAVFILIIACINFINLSTAKSANRAREVGLRKVVGSSRSSLVYQFLAESLLFSFLSFAIGLLIAAALLHEFNMLSNKQLALPISAWWFIPVMAAIAFIIGIIAGIYPAFYLSAFKPIQVLKGQVSRGSKNSLLRNGLVVFQFTTSIILIISTFVIYQQTHYILNKKVGFDKDQVVLLQGTNALGNKAKSFKQELLNISAVKSVSISDYLPISGTKRNGNQFRNEGKTAEESGVSTQVWIVDDDYIKTMGMKLVAGRNFSFEMPTDSMAAVINQTLANKLNLKDPIGKMITNGWEHFTVVGVVEDFNYETMRNGIEGVCLRLGNSASITSIKVSGKDMKSTIAAITAAWQKFSPSLPIRYNFMDESYARMYADVQRMGAILTSFAILAIIIACLGLFALSAFMAEQRTKEVGIRKVLGATIANITAMLSKDFLKLVLVAIVIASPIAWWAMSKWLQDFVYRIDIKWWVFVLSAIIAILIALATISFQSIKAAIANPVKSLKSSE